MAQVWKVPLVLTPQPEGGYLVTSPIFPELVSEGDTIDEAVRNAEDALKATIELYEDLGRPVPTNVSQDPTNAPIWFDHLVAVP